MALIIFAAALALAFMESRRDSYDTPNEWRSEVRISVVLGALAVSVQMLLSQRDAALPSPGDVAFLALVVFVADDFLYYVSHRLAHRVNLFWASHAVHHSPVRFDFFMGLRQPPTWLLTPAALAPAMLIVIGAPATLVALSAAIRALHHFVLHTERVRHLHRLAEFIFNTPSHHRVHHSVDVGCIDRNFGGILIVWDHLFGTFAAEPAQGIKAYGLVHANHRNAWGIVTDPWRRLAGGVLQAPSLWEGVWVVFAPPSSAHALPRVGHSFACGQLQRMTDLG
jgi:sterol desaturase/sphingolipid hydroxylase (fatty acid hydroxylase superfamily)